MADLGSQRRFLHRFKCDRAVLSGITDYARFVDEVPEVVKDMDGDSFRNHVVGYMVNSDPFFITLKRLGTRDRRNGAVAELGFLESVMDSLNNLTGCANRLNEFVLTEYAWAKFVGSLERTRCFPKDFFSY